MPLPFVLGGEGKLIPSALGLLEISSCQGLCIQVVLWDYLRAEHFCIFLNAVLLPFTLQPLFFYSTYISDQQNYAGASDSVINFVLQGLLIFGRGAGRKKSSNILS